MESLNAGTSVPENEILEKQRRQEVSDLLDQVFEGISYYDPHTLITIEPEKQSTIEEAAEAVISLREENRRILNAIKANSRFETPENTRNSEESIRVNSNAQLVFIQALRQEAERRREEIQIQTLSEEERKQRLKALIDTIKATTLYTQIESHAS